MNLTDQIENLFSQGVVAITIGQPPKGGGQVPNFFMKCQQVLGTGNLGCNAEIVHQTVGNSLVECVENMAGQVNGGMALQKEPSALVQLPRNNGR